MSALSENTIAFCFTYILFYFSPPPPPTSFRFFVLENQSNVVSSLVERGVRHLVYLIHSRIEAVQAAVAHVAMCRSGQSPFEYTVLVMPRHINTCEILLDQAGLRGDVVVRGCPITWVPLEEDVLSIEAPGAFKVNSKVLLFYLFSFGGGSDTFVRQAFTLSVLRDCYSLGWICIVTTKPEWNVGSLT